MEIVKHFDVVTDGKVGDREWLTEVMRNHAASNVQFIKFD